MQVGGERPSLHGPVEPASPVRKGAAKPHRWELTGRWEYLEERRLAQSQERRPASDALPSARMGREAPALQRLTAGKALTPP